MGCFCRGLGYLTSTVLLGLILFFWLQTSLIRQTHEVSDGSRHILLPQDGEEEEAVKYRQANLTLREFLTHPNGFHLAMAPAFFGFYGYFGVLDAWRENIGPSILTRDSINSVAGASAGAIAAVLLAAGISPERAAEFCRSLTLDQISDFPGAAAVFRGHRVETLMQQFLEAERPDLAPLRLENSVIPVAVTGFDLSTMQGKILSTGEMARAARASATFPFLFQPISWTFNESDYMLVDGGITDLSGMVGLSTFIDEMEPARIINLQVGAFLGSPPGPSSLSCKNATVVSISIRGLPQCGPWALENGPVSVEVAKRAMSASLDLPLYHGSEPNHYELHIDSTSFREKEKWDLKRMYRISKNMATMTKTSLVPMMSKAMVEAERIRPHVMEGLRLLLRYR